MKRRNYILQIDFYFIRCGSWKQFKYLSNKYQSFCGVPQATMRNFVRQVQLITLDWIMSPGLENCSLTYLCGMVYIPYTMDLRKVWDYRFLFICQDGKKSPQLKSSTGFISRIVSINQEERRI